MQNKTFIDKKGFEINVFSLEAFETALNGIVTPKEFVLYLPWRYERMKNYDYHKFPFVPTKEGIITPDIFKIHQGYDVRNDERFNVATYIFDRYPDHPISQKDEILFNGFCKSFADSEENNLFARFLADFSYLDISLFWNQWRVAFIDEDKSELNHFGRVSTIYDIDIFIFCKCKKNANLYPRVAERAISLAYKSRKFKKAFVLIVSRSDKPNSYNIELRNLDFATDEQKG